jgi:hypothetical protein
MGTPDEGTQGWGDKQDESLGLGRLVALVLGLTGAVWLAWSNPSTDEYMRFVEVELQQVLDQTGNRVVVPDQQVLLEIIRPYSRQLVESVVRPATTRHNWGLFSLYETMVGGSKVVVLGIGGRFVPLTGVKESLEKIKD